MSPPYRTGHGRICTTLCWQRVKGSSQCGINPAKLAAVVHRCVVLQVTAPGSVYCRDARDTACFSLDITLDGMPETQGLEKVPPSGKAVFLLDGAKVLQYR